VLTCVLVVGVGMQAVLNHEEIKDAMKRKVSRERIGIEVRKMLSGKDPARAFHLLSGFGLLDIVFNDPEWLESATDSNSNSNSQVFAPREWTAEIAEAAHSTLRSLQNSRLALAGHQISFVESSGAILSALFLPSTPQVEASVTSLKSIDQVASMDEEELIKCAIRYVHQRDAITYALPLDELVEMLKTNVKWPKPAAKRAALIVEAVATFPTASHATDSIDEQSALAVTRFMWMTRYNSVLAPAVSILLSRSSGTSDDNYATQKALLDLAAQYANSEDNKRRRVDGREVKERLGQKPGPEIARALSVLHVWEALHPAGTVDGELEFLERLTPHL
jgi:tRNA nucleotidyltransferase (CCA-adding enzyme)